MIKNRSSFKYHTGDLKISCMHLQNCCCLFLVFYCLRTLLCLPHNKHLIMFKHTWTHSITSDLIVSRQTVPVPWKVCHRAINLRKEHESIRSEPLAAVRNGKSNTHLQGRVCDKLRHDKKSLIWYLERRLECSYLIFTLFLTKAKGW